MSRSNTLARTGTRHLSIQCRSTNPIFPSFNNLTLSLSLLLDDSQVKALCKDGALALAQSCIFYPKGPSGIGREGEPAGEVPPVIYVEAPHVYYSKHVPKQPPCPKHGWESTGEVGVPFRGVESPHLGKASGKRYLLHVLCFQVFCFCVVLFCCFVSFFCVFSSCA